MKDFMNVRPSISILRNDTINNVEQQLTSCLPGRRCTPTSSSAASPTASPTSLPSRCSPRRRAASCAASTSSSRAPRDSARGSRSRTLRWHSLVLCLAGKEEEEEDEEKHGLGTKRGDRIRRMIEGDEEQFRKGSDAVLFEQPGICMEFLNLSRDDLREGEKEWKRKRTRLYGAWVFNWWVGSIVRIILRYYEPSPHHVQAMNASLAWILNTFRCLGGPFEARFSSSSIPST
jgi:hypothetical protein